MAVKTTPINTGAADIPVSNPPYPVPKTVDETKSNLRFFIEQANYKPDNLGVALGKSRSYCASWVANIKDKPPQFRLST